MGVEEELEMLLASGVFLFVILNIKTKLGLRMFYDFRLVVSDFYYIIIIIIIIFLNFSFDFLCVFLEL